MARIITIKQSLLLPRTVELQIEVPDDWGPGDGSEKILSATHDRGLVPEAMIGDHMSEDEMKERDRLIAEALGLDEATDHES